MLAESSARVERIQESYDALQEAKRTFASDFRQLLKTYTEVMNNMEISSAKEIESSLRQRLDTESIAIAREAATHEQDLSGALAPEAAEPADTGPMDEVDAEAASAEDDAATRRIEPEAASQPTPEEIDSEIAELEATEPEMESSQEPVTHTGPEDPDTQPDTEAGPSDHPATADEPAAVYEAAPDEEPSAEEPAAEEVDREEEPTLAEESSSQSFFDRQENTGSSEEGKRDNRIFRASRFLRRRE